MSTLVRGRFASRGDAIEVSVQLDNTADGSRIWERVYRTMSSNVQGLQHEMTLDLSRQLRLQPTANKQRRLTARSTDNADAYRLYLKGRHQSNRMTVDGLKRGIEFMNQAIAADPTYALAYPVWPTRTPDAAGVYLTSAEAIIPRVRAAAERALTFDPSLVEARALLAYVEGLYEWKWQAADADFTTAIQLRPNLARTHEAYAYVLMIQGRHAEALEQITRAIDLDPLTSQLTAKVGWFHYMARRQAQALATTQRAVQLEPTLSTAHFNLGMVYADVGRFADAIRAFEHAQTLDPQSSFISALISYAYARKGDTQHARKLLEPLIARTAQGEVDPAWIAFVYRRAAREGAGIRLARSGLPCPLRLPPLRGGRPKIRLATRRPAVPESATSNEPASPGGRVTRGGGRSLTSPLCAGGADVPRDPPSRQCGAEMLKDALDTSEIALLALRAVTRTGRSSSQGRHCSTCRHARCRQAGATVDCRGTRLGADAALASRTADSAEKLLAGTRRRRAPGSWT